MTDTSQNFSADASGAMLTMPGEDLSPSDFLAALCLASLCLVIGYMLFKVIVMSPPPSLNVWWCLCLFVF